MECHTLMFAKRGFKNCFHNKLTLISILGGFLWLLNAIQPETEKFECKNVELMIEVMDFGLNVPIFLESQ